MFAGRRGVFGDGMVAAGGLLAAVRSALLFGGGREEMELRFKECRGESGEWRGLRSDGFS
jgi:hypothetical protein